MVETSRSEGGVGPANVGTEAFNGFVDFVMKPYFSWLPGSLVCLVCGVRRACLRAGWLIHVPGFCFCRKLVGLQVFWAAVHDLAEFFGGISLALGLLTRYSAGILSATMAMAVYFHLASTVRPRTPCANPACLHRTHAQLSHAHACAETNAHASRAWRVRLWVMSRTIATTLRSRSFTSASSFSSPSGGYQCARFRALCVVRGVRASACVRVCT